MSISKQIEDRMQSAIALLANSLECEPLSCATHLTIIVKGWHNSTYTRQAIAHYLVGLRACAIDAALQIRSQLEETEQDRLEIWRDVVAIVGSTNDSLTASQKQTDRNPWIAEATWHLLLVIAKQRPEFHCPGQIIALDYAHVAAKDHGLDVAALYQSPGDAIGLTLVESKAYKSNPNGAIADAVTFFREVDEDKHAPRIRQSVQVMRSALAQEQKSRITGSFWKRLRSYLPNPHYDAQNVVDWSYPRPSFRDLVPGSPNIIIMPNAIPDFDTFFDQVSDQMRAFARSL